MRRARDQRGQPAAEMLGVLLVVSFIVAALFATDAPAAITSKTKELICRIGGGACASPKPMCVVSSGTRTTSGEVFVNARYVKVTVDDEPDVNDTRATGKAGVEISRALGATVVVSGPNKGDRTVYYEVSGSGELKGDAVIGPLVNAALGGKLTGKARVAVTVDANGDPKSLRVTHTVEGEVAVGLKNSRSTTFGDLASTTPFYARETGASKGTGLEVTTTVDLKDPRLSAAARRAFTGRDPVTGEPVDRSDAAVELGRAASNATNFTARTYDYDKRSDRHDVDLVVVGGAGSQDTSHQRTTGFGAYDPETGQLTWTNGCPR